MVLTDVKPDGRILYAIAVENHETQAAGFVYLHAKDLRDAWSQILQSNQLRKGSRVISVAPALGVHVTLDERDNVKEINV